MNNQIYSAVLTRTLQLNSIIFRLSHFLFFFQNKSKQNEAMYVIHKEKYNISFEFPLCYALILCMYETALMMLLKAMKVHKPFQLRFRSSINQSTKKLRRLT